MQTVTFQFEGKLMMPAVYQIIPIASISFWQVATMNLMELIIEREWQVIKIVILHVSQIISGRDGPLVVKICHRPFKRADTFYPCFLNGLVVFTANGPLPRRMRQKGKRRKKR